MTEALAKQSCPRCKAVRLPEATECGRCGIVFARYAPERSRARSPSPPMTSSPHVPPAAWQRVLETLGQSISAGVTLSASAAAGALDPLPAPVARALRGDFDAGVPLSQSLERLGLLDAGTRAVLAAAEARGGLPDALRLAAAQLGRARKLRNGLLLSLAYPLLLLVAATVILPLPLAFREGLRAYLAWVVPLLAVITAISLGVVVGIPRLGPSSPVSRAARWIGARVPIASQAAQSDARAAFFGVLGACLKAGLPARESLTLAAQAAAPHRGFEHAAGTLVEAVEDGATLADALRLLPAMGAADLAQVGSAEHAGALDQVLPALEAHHRDRARVLWLLLTGLVAGAILLGVTALVVAQILHGWMEIFRAQGEQIDRIMK
jgi:type II secretory pathway component PulF/ribosomal protein L40E